MKKLVVVLITVVLLASFGGLVWYALRHSRGMPVEIETPQWLTLEAPFLEKEIDLKEGISQGLWDSLGAKEIKLLYQVMVMPWPKALTPLVKAKAFHNKKEIYFYLEWNDDTEDRILEVNKFSDACAAMFPLDEKTQIPSLMMGFLGKANIWHWKASQDREFWRKEERKSSAYADYHYPFEEQETFPVSKETPKSAVNDLIAIRVGTVTPKETQTIEGRGFWQDGVWRVVIKRMLNTADTDVDAKFNIPKRLCAFAVWNGAKGDRGGRKSISDWVELEVK